MLVGQGFCQVGRLLYCCFCGVCRVCLKLKEAAASNSQTSLALTECHTANISLRIHIIAHCSNDGSITHPI